jgi:1-deoxy-D-xylulose-5-phosphate synthase
MKKSKIETKLLDTINSPADLKELSLVDMEQLAEEIRQTIVETVSETGGHLAPSLGPVWALLN